MHLYKHTVFLTSKNGQNTGIPLNEKGLYDMSVYRSEIISYKTSYESILTSLSYLSFCSHIDVNFSSLTSQRSEATTIGYPQIKAQFTPLPLTNRSSVFTSRSLSVI